MPSSWEELGKQCIYLVFLSGVSMDISLRCAFLPVISHEDTSPTGSAARNTLKEEHSLR